MQLSTSNSEYQKQTPEATLTTLRNTLDQMHDEVQCQVNVSC